MTRILRMSGRGDQIDRKYAGWRHKLKGDRR